MPQGCPLSMMFIIALYVSWCRYLGALGGVRPQLYADNMKCVPSDPALLFRAARFTAGCVRLVGQEPAPNECFLLCRSKEDVRAMRSWVLSDPEEKWTVKFDVRDLGGPIDTSLSGPLL